MNALLQATVSSVNALVLAAAALGLLVNTLTVLGVAWKGGRLIERVENTMTSMATEAAELRKSRDEHDRLLHEQAILLERVAVQVENVEARVTRLEDRP